MDEDRVVQPHTLDGEVWIAADARLDGRADLVTALGVEGDGVSARTPDAELLLRAYRRWGEGCLGHIIGDFVFAIWDRRKRGLFCARDHFGVTPLYYATAGNRLFFSNTLECLLLHPEVSDELDDEAVGDFLLFGMNMNPATTTFARIRRLPPAHALSWSGGTLTTRRYWEPAPWSGFVGYRTAGEYVERFGEHFTQAVADRLRTNRLSVQLSGGMDSTSVTVAAHRRLVEAGKPFAVRAFTTVLDGLMPDEEGRYARMVAEALDIPAEYLAAAEYPSADPLGSPDFVPQEPIAYRPTGLAYDAARRASRHAPVQLTGLGGDPMFMFAPSYWIKWFVRGELKRLAAATWHSARLFHRLPKPYLRASWLDLRRPQTPVPVPDWLDPIFARRAGSEDRSWAILRASREATGIRGMASAPFWSNIFGWSDPGFTRLPLKFRHPFFDLRLVGYMLTVPPSPWCEGKALLRRAMHGLLPEPVRTRRKTLLARPATCALAEQRGLHPHVVRLVAGAPGLDRFLDRDRFVVRLSSLAEAETPVHRALLASLGLAYWLYHWRRPAASPAGTPAMSGSMTPVHVGEP
jgi:asparagine synthase (glutamine-hydrolysing)